MKTVNLNLGKIVILLAISLLNAGHSFSQSTHVVLNVTDLINFSGKWNDNSVNLDCKLAQDHSIAKVYIERSNNGGSEFERIAEINTTGTRGFHYRDLDAEKSNNLYRLVLYKSNSQMAYSKILKIDNETLTKLSFIVYPTVISGSTTLSISSEESFKGNLQIVDMNGHTLSQHAVTVQQGTTITDLQGANDLTPGTYMVVLYSDRERLVQRIVVSK